MSKRQPSRADFNAAATMQVLLGSVSGVRLSAAQVKGRAFAEWAGLGRNAQGEAWIQSHLDRYRARGWIEDAPGPRGGKGYALTAAGAEWQAWALAWTSPATKRAEAAAERKRQHRAQHERAYRANIEGREGTRSVTVRALDMAEAVQLVTHQLRRHVAERITAVAEAAA